ncbi:MAG: FKBP-type peptidyl-prolyl cis-trans isomerase [Pseudomonadota bacterium]
MFKTFAVAAAGLILVACSAQEEPKPEMNIDDPLATLIPWDATAENVQTTATGLQYVVVREGSDDGVSPSVRDTVSVHYDGRLTDGRRFDSSYERGSPSTFGVGQVISGWTEGLQLMSEGDEFVFYIPTELGYGLNPRPGGLIQPGDDLIFRVELKQVVKAPEPRKVSTETWEAYTPWDSDRDGVVKTGSGLEYVIIESGEDSGVNLKEGDMAVLYYEGRLDTTGEMFDSAFQRGEASMFPAGGLIPGFNEALYAMKRGDRWLVHIPSDLAYGPRPNGPIPANSDLNFEIELMDIVPAQ